jgi:SAM-dependent methyltransferase
MFDRPEYWSAELAEARERRTLEGPAILRREVRGWLDPALPPRGVFVDVGCGLGALLSAASLEGRHGSGIDLSLHLLVAARRLIVLHGGQPDLACAFAEHLPLRAGVVDGIVMYDALEHFSEQEAAIAEAARVLAPGGVLSAVIPNRFSLAAEPHVGVWGVGWLPRRFQRAYVQRRSRQPYDDVRLPSSWEAAKWLRRAGLRAVMEPKHIPEEEIAFFSPRRARLARTYNTLREMPVVRNLLLRFGPSLQIRARKPNA